MDKIIFEESLFKLESEIVNTDVGIRIKLIDESKGSTLLDSFNEFIKSE